MSTTPVSIAPAEVSPAEPGPAPRPLAPLERRRLWLEPSVRRWWLLAAAMAVVIVYFCGSAVLNWREDAWLIRSGVPVTATVTEAGGTFVMHRRVPAESQATIEFDWHGNQVTEGGTFEDRTENIEIGQPVQIRVSPSNPAVWTTRTVPPSLGHSLFVGLILLPVLAPLAIAAGIAHRRLVALWRNGEPAVGVIQSIRQSPIAPRSYALRCTYRDRRNKVLQTVFVPKRRIDPVVGGPIWLIAPPTDSTARPLAWQWVL